MVKIIIPVVAILIVLVAFFKVDFLRVQTVNLSFNSADCLTQSLTNELKLLGSSLLFIKQADLSKTVSAKYLCVSNITAEKKLPNTLNLKVNGRQPVLVLNTAVEASETGVPSFLVDGSGLVFEQEDRPGVPHVRDTDDDLKVGLNLGDKIAKVAQVAQKLKELNLAYTDLVIEDNYLEATDDNPQTIVFNLSGDVSRELASLQLILQTGKINSDNTSGLSGRAKVMERVDLRFDKPVVTYSSKKS